MFCLVQLHRSNTVPVPVAIQRSGETLGGRAAHVQCCLERAVLQPSGGGGNIAYNFLTLWKTKLQYLDAKGRPSPWSEPNYLLNLLT